MNKLYLLLFTVLFSGVAIAQDHMDCFSVLAGKNTTSDGSVMLAHNEDDFGDVHFNMYLVPSSKLPSGPVEAVSEDNNTALQPSYGFGFMWLEMPGMDFSDSFMNENGVVISSDACPSREDQPELTDGGVTWQLRYAMAVGAKSARNAVQIAAEIIQAKGYNSSGRTYLIADPNEAWMLSVVNGKHFVAKRIPDSTLAIIPNYYTITDVNTGDIENVLASPDLVSYAIARGWYTPEKDGAFNFRNVYGSVESLQNMGNIGRMWAAVNMLGKKTYKPGDDLPWVIIPKKKIELTDLMTVLANHYEGTAFDCKKDDPAADVHLSKPASVCSNTTRYGFVAQLRSSMPLPVGCVLWLAPYRPCTNSFSPLYLGMDKLPDGFGPKDYNSAIVHHLAGDQKPGEQKPNMIYQKFFENTNKLNLKNPGIISEARKKFFDQTVTFIRQQPVAEKLALYTIEKMPKESVRVLTNQSIQAFEKALKLSTELADKQ